MPSSRGTILYLFLGILGVVATFFALTFGLVLPLFVPPVVKWSGYAALWTPVGACAALGPWLAVFGLFLFYQIERTRLWQTFQMILGGQLLLLGLVWLGVDIYRFQKVGWLAMTTVPQWKFPFYGIWAGPSVLAMGVSLLSLRRWRNHIGLALSMAAYSAITFLGLYLNFYRVAPRIMVLVDRKTFQMQSVGTTWSLIALGAGLVGWFLMHRPVRLRFHLIMTAPLWLPIFVVFFFWSLVINTTLYFLEDLLGVEWQPSVVVRITVVSWLSLLLFPILLTADFCIGLTRFLGQGILDRVFPPSERTTDNASISLSPMWGYVIGSVLLVTAPLWLFPTFLFWSVKLFVYESLLLPLLGKVSKES